MIASHPEDKQPKRKRKQPAQEQRRLSDEKAQAMGQIFPGFAEWYLANHDENGRYIGKPILGLQGDTTTKGES